MLGLPLGPNTPLCEGRRAQPFSPGWFPCVFESWHRELSSSCSPGHSMTSPPMMRGSLSLFSLSALNHSG